MNPLLRDFVYNKRRPSPWSNKRPGAFAILLYLAILAVSIWLVVR